MATFCTRLSTLYDAGIPLTRCFGLLEESRSRELRLLAQAVRHDLERGATLTEAVRARRRRLPGFFIEMIAAGEEAGAVETVLRNLGDDYEAQVEHRRAVQKAVTYPICVVLAALVVIPIFRMVMLGASMEQVGMFLVRSLTPPITIVLFVSAWSHFVPMRPTQSALAARIRSMSWIVRNFDLANALRALAALYASGLPLARCLERAAAISANPGLRKTLNQAVGKVRNGATLAESISAWRGFPRDTLNLLAVGEQSGKLDSALSHAARALRDAAAHRLRMWLISLESLLILALGFMIVVGAL